MSNLARREHALLTAVAKLRTSEFVYGLLRQRERGRKNLERPDWVWEALIGSAATLGRIPCLCILDEHRADYAWQTIIDLSAETLTAVILNAYTSAGVRYPRRKAGWAPLNRDKILDLGGPAAVKTKWLGLPIDEACKYFAQFTGVSDKYARNIGMDVARPDFEDSAALDFRLLTILRCANPALPTTGSWYTPTETYAGELARRAKTSLWEFDRTLFSTYDLLKQALGIPGRNRKRKGATHCARHAACPYAGPVASVF